jgi:hypothetical protein
MRAAVGIWYRADSSMMYPAAIETSRLATADCPLPTAD